MHSLSKLQYILQCVDLHNQLDTPNKQFWTSPNQLQAQLTNPLTSTQSSGVSSFSSSDSFTVSLPNATHVQSGWRLLMELQPPLSFTVYYVLSICQPVYQQHERILEQISLHAQSMWTPKRKGERTGSWYLRLDAVYRCWLELRSHSRGGEGQGWSERICRHFFSWSGSLSSHCSRRFSFLLCIKIPSVVTIAKTWERTDKNNSLRHFWLRKSKQLFTVWQNIIFTILFLQNSSDKCQRAYQHTVDTISKLAYTPLSYWWPQLRVMGSGSWRANP